MAAKGTDAKKIIEQKLQEVFGAGFVGVFDKKIYLNVTEPSGEVVQISVAMTCPKTPIGNDNAASGSTDVKPASLPIEISAEDTQTVEELMRELDL